MNAVLSLLEWLGAGLALAGVVGSLWVVSQRSLDRGRHTRTLANIARLEVELGFDVPLDQRIDRELDLSAGARPADSTHRLVAASGWYFDYAEQLHGRPIDREAPPDGWEPAQRVYGECKVCGLHVALNAGRCRGRTTDRKSGATCAKLEYAAKDGAA